jgi:hypothetical protein
MTLWIIISVFILQLGKDRGMNCLNLVGLPFLPAGQLTAEKASERASYPLKIGQDRSSPMGLD